MTPAGYSGTPLVRKLGIKPGMRMLVVAPPDDYRALLGELPEGVEDAGDADGPVAFIHVFARSKTALEQQVSALKGRMLQDGMLWASWPKKASGVETDLSGDVVRGVGLGAGLVDVKVCAVDDRWSGLKFVIRKADRSPSSTSGTSRPDSGRSSRPATDADPAP